MIGNVVLGVTGGIAAYKSADIVSRLKKLNINVDVIMTKNAQQFITPLTFQSLSGNKTITDMFDTDFRPDIEHISLAKKADIILIAPATANMIAKLANGIADDMLSTVVMASKALLIIAPAMNTVMYESAANQKNMQTLQERGAVFVEPVEGILACKDIGKGKMQEPQKIVDVVLYHLIKDSDLKGKKVLVTAGATIESVDPVRYFSNRSTGKMGYAMAQEAARRGAQVVLVSAKTNLEVPYGVDQCIVVESAQEMYQTVIAHAANSDIIIKSAAVADYRPKQVLENKMKKSPENLQIEMERTQDILGQLGKLKRRDQILVGFAAETQDVVRYAQEKLERKNLDLIVANDVKMSGAGFGTDTNIVTIIDKEGSHALPILSKSEVAKAVFDKISDLINVL